MSNLGPIWQDDEQYAPRRMDAKTIIRDTGANIVALATTRQIGLAIPTDTSGGLIKNVAYVVDYDAGFNRLAFVPVFGPHTHSSSTTGGDYIDIRHATSHQIVELNMFSPIVEDFLTTVSGSPTPTLAIETTSTSRRLKFETGGGGNAYITGRKGGVSLSFAQKCMFQVKQELTESNNQVTRTGINVDRVEDSQDTARIQFGLEGCDGHGTNYVIINANGNTSSLTATATTAVLDVAGIIKNYKIVQIPASEVRLYENGVSVGVSTSNVASTGDTDTAKLFTMTIKATAAVSRILRLWHAQIIGTPGTNELF
jgi:hypothetical protein